MFGAFSIYHINKGHWMWKTLLFTWFLVIVGLSFYPFQNLEERPSLIQIDKIAHFFLYFVLSVLLIKSDYLSDRYSVSYSVLLIVFFLGGIIEILQGAITVERHASFLDIGANMLGALSAIGIYRTLK